MIFPKTMHKNKLKTNSSQSSLTSHQKCVVVPAGSDLFSVSEQLVTQSLTRISVDLTV